MRRIAAESTRSGEPNRHFDLKDLSDIPAFLVAEWRPADLQSRTDARIRAYREAQAAEKEHKRKVTRYVPKIIPD
jgi:hypothetical protein